MAVLVKRWGITRQKNHKIPPPSFFQRCKCFSICSLSGLKRRCCKKRGPCQIFLIYQCGYRQMSLWTSCFPPLDEQRFLGDRHKCQAFYINAVNIIVWVTFTSDCVSSWERMLFKCWHLKMKIGWELEAGWFPWLSSATSRLPQGSTPPFHFLWCSWARNNSPPFPIHLQAYLHTVRYHAFWRGKRYANTSVFYLYSPNTEGST